MSAIAGQLELRVRRPLKPIPDADYAKLRSEAEAVKYACENSGLLDKSIAIEADIDPAILSKAKSGQARLNDEKLNALMDATGIEAPMFSMVLRRGYDPRSLRRLETETERQLREAREQLDAERLKVRVLTAALRGESA